ncbi:MAG: ABC transporter permease subunit [Clostridia bacterium]|nr:ABC transporter permease subunit [Clostridia bacterium]
MKSFIAFFKKEVMESARSGKLILLGILFFLFGVMNPAIAKLTPWMLEMLSESMAETGMVVTGVTVDANTSWTQFFKNIPMALIAFVLIYGGIFTREYEKGTLVLMLTKGLARYKVVLSKAALILGVWSAGYWMCFAVTYAYNSYFWDNSVAKALMTAVLNWWIFGIWVCSLMTLFSVLTSSYSGVLLGTGATVLASYLVGLLPKVKPFTPASLMNSGGLLVGAESAEDYIKAVAVACAVSIICLALSVPILNKKHI